MHDKYGQKLQVGDIVTITAEVTQLTTTEDYCNVSLKTVDGRRPDGINENIYAINTGVLVRIARKDE